MRVSEDDITITRIELQPGDTAFDLYDFLAEFADEPISIVDGALEIRSR